MPWVKPDSLKFLWSHRIWDSEHLEADSCSVLLDCSKLLLSHPTKVYQTKRPWVCWASKLLPLDVPRRFSSGASSGRTPTTMDTRNVDPYETVQATAVEKTAHAAQVHMSHICRHYVIYTVNTNDKRQWKCQRDTCRNRVLQFMAAGVQIADPLNTHIRHIWLWHIWLWHICNTISIKQPSWAIKSSQIKPIN